MPAPASAEVYWPSKEAEAEAAPGARAAVAAPAAKVVCFPAAVALAVATDRHRARSSQIGSKGVTKWSAKSAQIPLNPLVTEPTRVKTPAQVKAMPIDFSAAAARFSDAAEYIEKYFLQ